MGQNHSKAPKRGKHVQSQKCERAKATGILSLTDSKLKRIPDKVFELTNLNTLDLSHNALTELPIQITTQFLQLKVLKLQGNKLTMLPDLSALTKLTHVRSSYKFTIPGIY